MSRYVWPPIKDGLQAAKLYIQLITATNLPETGRGEDSVRKQGARTKVTESDRHEF